MSHEADDAAHEAADPTGGDEDLAGASEVDPDTEIVDAEVVPDEPDVDPDEPDAEADADADADAEDLPDDPGGVFDATARERDEYLAALRQVQADFENYRKQALKRQGDAIEHATGRLIEELLPVFDACDAGIEHGDQGVTAIFTTLLGVLEKQGLERLDPLGEPFDPNAHEAVMHEPAGEDDDAAGPVVVEVMRPGYRWKERTLRAAMVKVRG